MPKKDAPPKGLRIQIKGLRTTKELRAMLHEAVDRLEAFAVTHVRGTNLYLTPADKDAHPVTPLQDGRKVETLTIENPYASAADEHGA